MEFTYTDDDGTPRTMPLTRAEAMDLAGVLAESAPEIARDLEREIARRPSEGR